jgi:glycosyltransferase involved in cell wall biosynthesis
MNNPLVSIVCLTYNHSAFLSQCLDSFLSQETNFPFEILIHDDASTDDTLKIIEAYKQKHPTIIKTFIQKENQFSKGLGFVGIQLCFKMAKGKYIAYCEGDDYLCDSKKLQKQVDFLEANYDYSACAHDTKIISNSNNNNVLYSDFVHNIFLKKTKNIYTITDTFTGNIFHISSIMFRNVELNYPKWINRFSAFDMIFFMLLAEKGNIYYMDYVMSVYRSNEKSVTSTRKEYSSEILFLNMSLHIVRLMNRYFGRRYQNYIYKIVARYYMELVFLYLKKSNRSVANALKMGSIACKYNCWVCIKYLIAGFLQIIKRRLV